MKTINTIRNYETTNLLIIFLRFLIGGTFIFAGVPKVFIDLRPYLLNPPTDELSIFLRNLHLGDGLYWKFIGVSQIIAGALLITQRFALIGAMMLLPIVVNMVVITQIFDFNMTKWITMLLLLANLLLLFWDYQILQILFQPYPKTISNQVTPIINYKFWEKIGLFLCIESIALGYYQKLLSWLIVSFTIGIIALFIYNLSAKKNIQLTNHQ